MQRKLNKHVFLIGVMLFSTLFAFLIIDLFPKNKRAIGDLLISEANLKQEILQLESHLFESQEVIIFKDDQLDRVGTLLEEKYVELDNMTQKAQELKIAIGQLERQGNTDRQTIKEMERQLADITGKLLGEYKSQIGHLVRDLSLLNHREDSLVQENQKNSHLLLQAQRQYLDCLDGKERNQVPVNKEIPQTSTMEFDFQATNIRVISFDKNGIPFHKTNNNINTKDATRLSISFDFVGKDVVAPELLTSTSLTGEHKLYVVIKDRRMGQTIVNPAQSSSGEKFIFREMELTSTFPIMVNYQGESQQVMSEYIVGESFEYILRGQYKLEIYWKSKGGTFERIGSENLFFR